MNFGSGLQLEVLTAAWIASSDSKFDCLFVSSEPDKI